MKSVFRYLAGLWQSDARPASGPAEHVLHDHQAAHGSVLVGAARTVLAASVAPALADTQPIPARPPLRPLPPGPGADWLEDLFGIQVMLNARIDLHGTTSLTKEEKLIANYLPGEPVDAPTLAALRDVGLGEERTTSQPCGHFYLPGLCPRCHSEVCQLPHDGERGRGCKSGQHATCTGFTEPFDTYRCDCICHCPRQTKELTRA